MSARPDTPKRSSPLPILAERGVGELPLSEGEKPDLALKNRPLFGKNLLYISSLDQIWEGRSTAELGAVGSGLAADWQRIGSGLAEEFGSASGMRCRLGLRKWPAASVSENTRRWRGVQRQNQPHLPRRRRRGTARAPAPRYSPPKRAAQP